ncbi:MAG: PTS fructose transporter subunit IIC [Micrococcaceae bacterium]
MEAKKNSKQIGKELVSHFQSGVSYMIPLVTAAGLLTSIAVIFGGSSVWKETDTFWGVVRMIGQTGLEFIVPMISGYIAFSIADRPGLAPAFVTGMIAQNMGTGYLGGMFTGLAVGYLVHLLKKMPVHPKIMAIKSLLIIPFIATSVVGLVLWYIVGSPIQHATAALTSWLNGMSGVSAALLGAIIGAMMASDMGGPINKIAYAFGVAAFAQGGYVASTAMLLAIGMPPFGMFLATLLNKKLYSETERENGVTAMIMGAVGITEGTIPFAVVDPIRVIPSIMVGTSLTCALNGWFGATQNTMLTTFMAIPFASKPIPYVISILIGGFVIAFMVNGLKMMKLRKTKKLKDEADVEVKAA